jgi:hypothetical protein
MQFAPVQTPRLPVQHAPSTFFTVVNLQFGKIFRYDAPRASRRPPNRVLVPRVRERKTLMNNWLKRGALALTLGAFCTLSGAASAVPKPGILTPPTKAENPAAAKAAVDKSVDAKVKPGEPIAKIDGKDGKPELTPGASASASATASAGAVAAVPEVDEKVKEAAAVKRKEWKEARKAKAKEVRAEVKKKVEAALKGKPMVTAMREELQRHARRLARLDRVKTVASEANDTDTVTRVDKLIEKENARHNKWMASFEVKAAAGDKAGAK